MWLVEAAGSGWDEDVACSVAVLVEATGSGRDEDVACSVAVLFLSFVFALGLSKPAAPSNAFATVLLAMLRSRWAVTLLNSTEDVYSALEPICILSWWLRWLQRRHDSGGDV